MNDTKRFLPFIGLFLLGLSGCGSREHYLGRRIDWRAPVLLDSGKVGFFQAAWDDYETSCGYFGDETCADIRNIRVHFLVLSPGDGVPDTLFETLSGGYDFSIGLGAQYVPPYLVYSHQPVCGAYNLLTGAHHRLPQCGEFSRSGNYVTGNDLPMGDGWRIEVATAKLQKLIPKPWQIDYYDDVSGKAIVFRWVTDHWTGRSNVLYDAASGTLDSSRPSLSGIGRRDRGRIVAQGFRYAPVDAFDLTAPAFPESAAIAPGTGAYFGSEVTDFDPATERVLREVRFGPDDLRQADFGIAIGDFDGSETVYRATDFHPGYTRFPQ